MVLYQINNYSRFQHLFTMKLFYRSLLLFFFSLCFYSCEFGKDDAHDHDHEHFDSITLENCYGSIDADAPDFYKNYFNCVDVSVSGGAVSLSTKGLPPYESMYYSEGSGNHIDFVSQGDGYYLNPNTIAEQSYYMSIPDAPVSLGLTINSSLVDGVIGTSNNEYDMNAQGIAINGVIIFNPLAGPGDDIEDEKYSFDPYNGHPEMTGTYHYHTTSKGPLESLVSDGFIETAVVGSAEIELYGMMCDGTLVLGCTELDGSEPSSSDFDAQNGHVHDITDGTNVFFSNRYHTHICTDTYTTHRFTPEIQYYEGCN